MALLLVTCPHCRTRVVPTEDSTCPSCRKMIPGLLAGAKEARCDATSNESELTSQESPSSRVAGETAPRMSSGDEKIACSKCGRLILARMARLNDGLCTKCTTIPAIVKVPTSPQTREEHQEPKNGPALRDPNAGLRFVLKDPKTGEKCEADLIEVLYVGTSSEFPSAIIEIFNRDYMLDCLVIPSLANALKCCPHNYVDAKSAEEVPQLVSQRMGHDAAAVIAPARFVSPSGIVRCFTFVILMRLPQGKGGSIYFVGTSPIDAGIRAIVNQVL